MRFFATKAINELIKAILNKMQMMDLHNMHFQSFLVILEANCDHKMHTGLILDDVPVYFIIAFFQSTVFYLVRVFQNVADDLVYYLQYREYLVFIFVVLLHQISL